MRVEGPHLLRCTPRGGSEQPELFLKSHCGEEERPESITNLHGHIRSKL